MAEKTNKSTKNKTATTTKKVAAKPVVTKPTTATKVTTANKHSSATTSAKTKANVVAKNSNSKVTTKSMPKSKMISKMAVNKISAKPTVNNVEKIVNVPNTKKKDEKIKKTNFVKQDKTNWFRPSFIKAKLTAFVKSDNFKIACTISLAILLLLSICLWLIFGLKSKTEMERILAQNPVTVNPYSQTTTVGYSAKTLGTVKRYKPVSGIHDEREAFPFGIDIINNQRYPTYGYNLSYVIGSTDEKITARQALIQESSYLCAYGTAGANRGGETTPDKYTWMDSEGWLYQGTRSAPVHSLVKTSTGYGEEYRRLYKHTASVGFYLGDVSPSEPGIIKQVTLRPRGYSSYSVTGVYAPAGEVIKIEISGKDMDATGGITIHIGQALYNGQANNIWQSKNQMQRMPHVLTTLGINKNTAVYDQKTDTWTGYVGSYLGGPLYVRNKNSTFSVKISGGVSYRHFILGYTSPEEYTELCKSSAPYFDLEVWDRGVLHSGPVRYAKAYSYDDLYNAAVLWEKVATVANSNGTGNCYNQGIVFLYDPFVAAGAAVAFPGRSSVNCPLGWMSTSLNYSAMVTSGSWGNFHEFHHNFQNYGVGYEGEVTNNALTLVSYSLFTKISSARQVSSYGAAGLSGWNRYTSATWALDQVNRDSITSTNGLAVYATLLHNLGQDAFLKARGYHKVNYLNRWATVTHQDFSYYAQQISTYAGNLTPASTNYPLFVPVSSVYQTGRSYTYDGTKRYIETMQPYVIPYGKSFVVDLNKYKVNSNNQYESGSVVIGNGFTYKIKSVNTKGINGTFKKKSNGIYEFTPNSEMRSGKIYVTLEITTEDGSKTWNGHALNDVDLVLEFQQSREYNRTTLERTTYYYEPGTKYTDAREAWDNDYAGYTSASAIDHSNPTQNSNTDIWYWLDNSASHNAHPNAPEHYFVNVNSITEVKGKLYFPEEGKYRIYLRGRKNCAVYYSEDNGKTYKLGAYIASSDTSTDWKSYFDVEMDERSWLYFKEVLINDTMYKNGSLTAGFVGLGIGQWTVPQYTAEVKYYIMENGNRIDVIQGTIDDEIVYYYTQNGTTTYVEDNNTVQTETVYKNASGNVVTAEQANNTDPIAPTSISYATAYRQSYEFPKQFESNYFYTRNYNYNYNDKLTYSGTPTLVSVSHNPWDETRVIDYLLDGKTSTTYHTQQNIYITEQKPFELVVNLGETFKANHVTFYGYSTSAAGNIGRNLGMPVTFTLYGSLDGKEFFELFSRINMEYNTRNLTFDFDPVELQYYKLVVTRTDNSRYFAMSEILFYYNSDVLTGNGKNLYSPDNAMFTYKGNWKTKSCSATFGHVYIGNKATVEFEFAGSRLAILASKSYGKNYEVYIDGDLVPSLDVLPDKGDYTIAYLCPKLSEGKHSVVIYCPSEANIDSIAIW